MLRQGVETKCPMVKVQSKLGRTTHCNIAWPSLHKVEWIVKLQSNLEF